MTEPNRHPTALRVEQLCVERQGRIVLHQISQTIARGNMVWIDGASGAGKTTLLMALARMIPSRTGSLYLQDTSAARLPAPEWRRKVLFVANPPSTLADTIEGELTAVFSLRRYQADNLPDEDVMRDELRSVGLNHLPLNRRSAELSLGQLARVALVRALLTRPEILLLDEPTANLDPISEDLVRERLQQYRTIGGTIIIAAHTPPWPTVTHCYRLRTGRLEPVTS